MKTRLRVGAERSYFNNGIKLYFIHDRESDDSTGMKSVMMPVTFAEVPEFSFSEPAMEIHADTAQKLMDELWLCGIRPTNGTGSVGQLAATEKHLEDMRALAFKTGKPK